MPTMNTGTGVGSPSPRFLVHQLRGKYILDSLEALQHCRLVIGDLPSPERIALKQVMERLTRITHIVKRFAQREMQFDLVLDFERPEDLARGPS